MESSNTGPGPDGGLGSFGGVGRSGAGGGPNGLPDVGGGSGAGGGPGAGMSDAGVPDAGGGGAGRDAAAAGGGLLSVEVAGVAAPLVSDVRVASVVARCAGLVPGPELVALLSTVEVARLAVADRVVVAVVWQRVANWVAAQRLLAIAAAAGPLVRCAETAVGEGWSLTGDEVDDMVCAEIGAALCVSPRSAAGMVDTARAAAGHLAPLTQRMLAGDFGEAHLARAETLCAQTSPQVARAAAQDVAEKAPARCTPTQLRGRLHRALVKRDPYTVRRRTRAASRERGVGLWADPDLRGRLDVTADWTACNRAYATLSDWATASKEHLRGLRKAFPGVRLCCPRAITDALNGATTLTAAGLTTADLTGGGLTDGDLAGAGLGGVAGDAATHTCAGAGPANLTAGPGLAGAASGRVGAMTVATARAVLAGPAPIEDPQAGTVIVGCRWCDATDMSLPTIDQLRADGLIEAIALLADTLTPSTDAMKTPTPPEAGAAGDGASRSAGTGAGADERAGQVPPLAPRRGRRWSHAVVVVDLQTALGLAESPGWIPGYGPVPAPIARELAAGATVWQRFLLDDDGALISTGRHTYRPSDRLRELVTARDLTCTFPGCGRPATAADLDHRENFNGSNTTASNLHPLCRTHHRLKTHTDWHVRRNPTTGQDTWTSPLGNTYTHTPHPPWQPNDNDPDPDDSTRHA